MATGTFIRRAVQRASWDVKRHRLEFKGRTRGFKPLRIFTFRGYGTPHALHLSGRLLEQSGAVDHPTPGTWWQNLGRTLQRFRSEEIPCATMRAHWSGRGCDFETDREGYFRVVLPLDAPLPPGWHEVELEVVKSLAGGEGLTARAEVLVPPEHADFGVISDIDDTVIHSAVTNRLRMVRIVMFHDAHGRIPLPGVSAFLRALRQGPSGTGFNPVFYVSRSPWNMYDLFVAVFAAHDLPRGPLFLRDLPWVNAPSQSLGLDQDKLSRIRRLLTLYPTMPFVLLGDSGQKDPEIYAQIVREHPGRIRAIYIRDVTKDRRAEVVRKLAASVREHDVPLLLERDTLDAAHHAVELGLIRREALDEIRGKERSDEAENEAAPALA